jgi:hypothetical protein
MSSCVIATNFETGLIFVNRKQKNRRFRNEIMKPVKKILLVLPLALCIQASRIHNVPENDPSHKLGGNSVRLLYTGTTNQAGGLSMGISVEMKPAVGFRYEVVFEKGTAVLSHNTLFYKFSTPTQSIWYNYLTHKATVKTAAGSSPGMPNISVIGTAVIDSFNCTHLQQGNPSSGSTDDYWMCSKVPGFADIVAALQSAAPDMMSDLLNTSIFQWGGLVKLEFSSKDGTDAILRLTQATTDIVLPDKDFNVPQK